MSCRGTSENTTVTEQEVRTEMVEGSTGKEVEGGNQTKQKDEKKWRMKQNIHNPPSGGGRGNQVS